MSKHIHVHLHRTTDAGTSEGARKAAQTRKAHGGASGGKPNWFPGTEGTHFAGKPLASSHGGAMTPVQRSLHEHWTSPDKEGKTAVYKGPLGGSSEHRDIQVYHHPTHGRVYIHPSGHVQTHV